MNDQLKQEITEIISEDAYNEGAFMFDDNKMRFCFTPDELLNKVILLIALTEKAFQAGKKERTEEIVQKIAQLPEQAIVTRIEDGTAVANKTGYLKEWIVSVFESLSPQTPIQSGQTEGEE